MLYKLTDKGVELDPAKVDAITKMPTPTRKSGVQHFCGMCQYLRKFCHNLSETERLDKRELYIPVVKLPWKSFQLSQEPHRISDCAQCPTTILAFL